MDRCLLGFDLATHRVGVAVFDDEQLVEVFTRDLGGGQDQLGRRLFRLRALLQELFEKYQPYVIGYERVVFASSALATLAFGNAEGQLLVQCYSAGVKAMEVAPSTIKKTAVGSGRAEKDDVLRAAREDWPALRFDDHNAADAAWCGVCTIKMLKGEIKSWSTFGRRQRRSADAGKPKSKAPKQNKLY